MSRKRAAAYQLTESNWDQDEEGNDVEEVKEAESSVKTERKIKKAVRRGGKSTDQGGMSNNPFQGFSGFSGFGAGAPAMPVIPSLPPAPVTATNTKADSNADFWKTTTGKNPFVTTTTADTKNAPESDYAEEITELNLSVLSWIKRHVDTNACIDLMPTFKDYEDYMVEIRKKAGSELKEEDCKDARETGSKTNSSLSDSFHGNSGPESNYTVELSDLNITVLAWIKEHVDENPCIDLTPVIKDYERFLADIEKKFGTEGKKEEDHKESEKTDKTINPISSESVLANTASTKVGLFSPPTKWNKDTEGETTVSMTPKAPGFFASLATSTPLPTKTAEEGSKPEGAGEDEEPQPKEERKTIVEEDAFHTIRCKLFFKKGSEWKELGVGMLYLKPMDKKTQLLVRMETATGKILLNICLSPVLPVSRTGKNNLTLLSIPNPPVFVKPADGDNSKPVTYLIRVKGATEADELYEKIKESKGT